MISNQKAPTTHQSLSELVTALSEEERTKFDNIIRSMKLLTSDFESYCSWSNDSYTRNCIIDNEKFELILLCWEPGQITPIHDHGGERCWVKIIEGEFKETIYQKNETGELSVRKITFSSANDITFMIDSMGFHSLENLSHKRSMSLHLYAKPIRTCNMFDEDSRKFISKDLDYHTVPEIAHKL